jgi:hypothetical protein
LIDVVVVVINDKEQADDDDCWDNVNGLNAASMCQLSISVLLLSQAFTPLPGPNAKVMHMNWIVASCLVLSAVYIPQAFS